MKNCPKQVLVVQLALSLVTNPVEANSVPTVSRRSSVMSHIALQVWVHACDIAQNMGIKSRVKCESCYGFDVVGPAAIRMENRRYGMDELDIG